MALTAKVVEVTNGLGVVGLKASVTTLTTGPYTYQWYKSGTAGFTPGAGNLIPGATTAFWVDTSGSGGYYACIVTDSLSATSTAADIINILIDTPDPKNNPQILGSTVLNAPQQSFVTQTTH
jgi:hypothetical protein